MSCACNLITARQEAQLAAEERRRRDEYAARRREARQFADSALASGQSRGDVYSALVSAGWERPEVEDLLGIGDHEVVLGLPGDKWLIIADAADAKAAKKELQLAKKELRLRKKELNGMAREVKRRYSETKPGPMGRQARYGRGNMAGAFRAFDDAGRAAHQLEVEQHRRKRDDALSEIDQKKLDIDRAIIACDRMIDELDEWPDAAPRDANRDRDGGIDIEFH